MQVGIEDPSFSIPTKEYKKVMETLKLVDYRVPCNSTKDIVYNLNGWELRVTPEDYIDKSWKAHDNTCFLYVNETPSRFFLSINKVCRK
jgi:hypothetical protein